MDTNLQKYKAFVKTVETGTFSRAAEALHYSQSGVSRMIADLETEWNVTLLERGKSGVRLTGDGMKLLAFAKSVCDEYDKLQNEVAALSGLSAGLIRIAIVPGVAAKLAEKLASFASERPGIEIDLLAGTYAETETLALSGEADFAITRIPTGNDFDTGLLFQDDYVAVLPANAEYAEYGEGSIFPVSAFCEYPFIRPGKGTGEDADAFFRAWDVSPMTRYRVSEDRDAVSLVRAGVGVTLLPESEARPIAGENAETEAPEGIRILPLDVPATRNIGYAIRNRKAASLVVRELLARIE